MNSYIKNPKILLLKCSIEYLYREETKFTSIDPIVLQVSIIQKVAVALLVEQFLHTGSHAKMIG